MTFQRTGLRGQPFIDDGPFRLRLDESKFNGAVCEGGSILSRDGLESMVQTFNQPGNRSPSGPASADDRPNRPISAMRMATSGPTGKSTKGGQVRRVRLGGGDDEDRAQELRLPGQTNSFSFASHASARFARTSHSGNANTASGSVWMSVSRPDNDPLSHMPPDGLPPLHTAAWYNDLDQVVELLKNDSDPLRDLIWYNKKLYPPPTSTIAGSTTTTATGTTTASGDSPFNTNAPTGNASSSSKYARFRPAVPPQIPNMETATAALKALLRRDYLHHACHPLTIAAAHGNDLIVDQLLKAMQEDARAGRVEHMLTWRSLPEGLPPGCPWVTPLAAAALGGNGLCVQLLAQGTTLGRRKSLADDRSTYGCYRFRPLVVAQSADAVHSLYQFGCCEKRTLVDLCEWARRMAYKLETGGGFSGRGGAGSAISTPALSTDLNNLDPDEETKSRGSPPDSPRSIASRADNLLRESLTANSVAESVLERKSITTEGGSRYYSQQQQHLNAHHLSVGSRATAKAAELMLFRARLFHDSVGRPLGRALNELQGETLVAVAALAALVEAGLHPDRFLSHSEHDKLSSTSLLMIVARNYRGALRSAGGAAAAGGAYGSNAGCGPPPPSGGSFGASMSALVHRELSSSSLGAIGGGGAAGSGGGGGSGGAGGSASGRFGSMARGSGWDEPAASDLLSAAHELLNGLVAVLLGAGAVVDDRPRDGRRLLGGVHMAGAHGPEEPMHYAFIHGPQELVVQLLRYSNLQPEARQQRNGGEEADGEAGGGGGKAGYGKKARAVYLRGPGQVGRGRRGEAQLLPWELGPEGSRSSPLLAFGAKMQEALGQGNLPLWLHNGRYSELMEDLIKCTIARDGFMVTPDLNWLVADLFERCMAHEGVPNAPQYRGQNGTDEGAPEEFIPEDISEEETSDGTESTHSTESGSDPGSSDVVTLGPAPAAAGSYSPPPTAAGSSAPPAPESTIITLGPFMLTSGGIKGSKRVSMAVGGLGAGTEGATRPNTAPGTAVAAAGEVATAAAAAGGGGGGRVDGSSIRSSGKVDSFRPGREGASIRFSNDGDNDDDADTIDDTDTSQSRTAKSSSLKKCATSPDVITTIAPPLPPRGSPNGPTFPSDRPSSSSGALVALVPPPPAAASPVPASALAGRSRKDRLEKARALLRAAEDNDTISIVHSLYRHTADAITLLHQRLKDGSLDGPLASMAGAGPASAEGAVHITVPPKACDFDWLPLLRLVARIAATTLNPPKSHGTGAGQISVFTTAKAVNQLLYAKDWAHNAGCGDDGVEDAGEGFGITGGDGRARPRSVVDIDLLRAIVRRHPHEAARLIHGMDLLRVELKGYRWDSIPMSLDQDCYAVFTKGERIKLSNRAPTVAPASVAAAAEALARQVAAAAAAQAGRRSARARLKGGRGAAVAPEDMLTAATAGGGGPPSPHRIRRGSGANGTVIWGPDTAGVLEVVSWGDGGPGLEPLSREDLLQACIFTNMWTVLTHFLLSSWRLPSYMAVLQRLRMATYWHAVLGQTYQYGSIPFVLGVGSLLTLLGFLARGLQGAFRLAGNLLLAGYSRLEHGLQPAMTTMGKTLQLERVQRGVGRVVRRVDQLTARATGGTVIMGTTALRTVRIIPRYLAFLGVLLDPDALAEVWLGVTQTYGGRGSGGGGSGGGKTGMGAGGSGGGGGAGSGDGTPPPYLSWRTTRVVVHRVPLACAAAMPSTLLYKLASSPQVNGELFSSPVMRAVITWRWQHYTRYFLLLQCLEHLLYMALFMVYAFSLSYDMFTSLLGESRTGVFNKEGCTLSPSGLQQFLLISLGVMTLTCVVQEMRQVMFFKLDWFRQPWNLMDFASSSIMCAIITLHLRCRSDEEWLRGLAAVEVALLFMRLLYFAMADDRLGSFFRMVIEVLRDCWLFFVFLGILFAGWGLALAVMQGKNVTVRDTYLQLFTMIFGDFQLSLLQDANAGSGGLNHLWRVFASLYQILVTIILLNLLIAIINDSYERINDNEACESLRNKLTLIVETESVLPARLARSMLESLAKTDLYVITAEAATVASTAPTDSGAANDNAQRRPLPPPARWSGRMGETKRFMSLVVDQLMAQQTHFQSRVLSMLAGVGNIPKVAADNVPTSGAGIISSSGWDAPGITGLVGSGRANHKRNNAANLGGLGGAVGGMRASGGGPGTGAKGAVFDIGETEVLAEVLELGRALRDKVEEMRLQQEEAMAGMTRRMQEVVERAGRMAAESAGAAAAVAAAAVATSPAATAAAGPPASWSLAESGTTLPGASGGSGKGDAGGELVLVERRDLEAIAQKAAEQAAQLAVQKVLRELGQGPRTA